MGTGAKQHFPTFAHSEYPAADICNGASMGKWKQIGTGVAIEEGVIHAAKIEIIQLRVVSCAHEICTEHAANEKGLHYCNPFLKYDMRKSN
jgi:hypothetical protein